MSKLIVKVCQIDSVKPHPNAEKLELAVVGGWQCVVPKGQYTTGSLITYIPVDSMIPLELSDKLGVTKYLSTGGRVRCTKLRGEPSFGVVAPAYGELGDDVAEKLGITKYVPPVKITQGDCEKSDPNFPEYTDVENMRNFTDLFVVGEEVVATEKLHGCNSRVGLIRNEETQTSVRVAGSRTLQRKENADSLYWFPWKVPGVAEMLAEISMNGLASVILYGEIYGRVQSLKYGVPTGLAYRVFDISVNGEYLDPDIVLDWCERHGIPTCPILYRGPFSIEAIRGVSNGPSLIPGASNIREGVVVRPVKERTDPRMGRVILKYVGDDYLLGGTEDEVGNT